VLHATDIREHTLPLFWPDRPVLDLPTPDGWKAELTKGGSGVEL